MRFLLRMRIFLSILLLAAFLPAGAVQAANAPKPGRDPGQPIDEEYTKKIREYTTQPFFNSPLVDYLPASQSVPTPKAVLGDIAGAPGKLPYAADVYRYMRMLEKASPRVKVYSIGTTEEGREMIAVAVASEEILKRLEENRAALSKLADPRVIGMDDSVAEQLIAAAVPVYYITGTIHSPETGAPTALMELAYRLAVDESPYIKAIRENVITLITPVVEVDGRDRQVDIYNWHLAHPNENWPPLVYWGHYIAHDNNRDAMGLSLKLTRNILNTFLHWKSQVLHDLHESVPYLYDNTVGDQPYNAWLDPILTDEWQLLGWNNVSEMTKFGMPGVFTHGSFDTWSPGYLMFVAASHNGISRLYETFGNGGADTVERTLSPQEYSRTWYRQNPPLPKTKWSQRNNNNYEQTGLLTSLSYFAANGKLFLRNFYLKSKRSIEKPKNAGPAAYVFPADDPRPGAQAELLRLLQAQGCEVSRAAAAFSAKMEIKKKAARASSEDKKSESAPENPSKPPAESTENRQFAAGSLVVRMDQPYSRVADMLLDYQYWSPDDPQKSIYDDTGWTFGELYNVQVFRVTDVKVLDVPMEKVTGEVRVAGNIKGDGRVIVVNNNADPALATLRYRLKDANFKITEEPFQLEGVKFNRGSFVIDDVSRADLERGLTETGLQAVATASTPSVKTHPSRLPRIAVLHTWLTTQNEGWWRLAFDKLGVPYSYISTQEAAREENLNSRYDVIIFAPVGVGNPLSIIAGMPMWGNPLPWKKTPLTPNLGGTDSTDDMRPGLGWVGLGHLRRFVERGGVLITATDTSHWAVNFGLTQGVSSTRSETLKAVGSVLRSRVVDDASPIVYGYSGQLSVYCYNGPVFGISSIAGSFRGSRSAGSRQRATGRGTIDDPDLPQGRPPSEVPEEPRFEPWQAAPVTDEQKRNGIYVIPPRYRPRVVLRYGDNDSLLVSGLLAGGGEIAQRPAVIDVPVENGHVVLFSINPIWRGETQGSYGLVLNTILNYDQLNVGRKLDAP